MKKIFTIQADDLYYFFPSLENNIIETEDTQESSINLELINSSRLSLILKNENHSKFDIEYKKFVQFIKDNKEVIYIYGKEFGICDDNCKIYSNAEKLFKDMLDEEITFLINRSKEDKQVIWAEGIGREEHLSDRYADWNPDIH